MAHKTPQLCRSTLDSRWYVQGFTYFLVSEIERTSLTLWSFKWKSCERRGS